MIPEGAIREVGGEIRRIAILTTGLHPCAGYLARRLRTSGAAIAVVNQRRLPIDLDSPAFFFRLLKKRGPLVALDCFLLFLVKRGAGAARAVARLGRTPADPPDAPAACLRPDPGIATEPWITFLEVENVNRDADRARLAAWQPDLVLLAGAPILSRRTIETASIACINAHCGITPDYAGSSPYDWPLVDGRYDDIGYTVHQVVPKVDSGPILWQERVPWDPGRPLRHLSPILTQKMYDRMADLVLEMAAGKRLPLTPQRVNRPRPPAGLFVRLYAEMRRVRYAARRRRDA